MSPTKESRFLDPDRAVKQAVVTLFAGFFVSQILTVGCGKREDHVPGTWELHESGPRVLADTSRKLWVEFKEDKFIVRRFGSEWEPWQIIDDSFIMFEDADTLAILEMTRDRMILAGRDSITYTFTRVEK